MIPDFWSQGTEDRGLATGFWLLAEPETKSQEPVTGGQRPEARSQKRAARDQSYCLKQVFMISMLLCFAGGVLGIVVQLFESYLKGEQP